jgi:hypothetical protein
MRGASCTSGSWASRVRPIVPIMLNTYYPPNQPTPKRCYQLGRAIPAGGGSVADPPAGGHRRLRRPQPFLRRRRPRSLRPRAARQEGRGRAGHAAHGQARIRELRDPELDRGGRCSRAPDMQLVDYVPSYRSEAGSGVGMAFAFWQ